MSELKHYGVQGMKWGRRKPKVTSTGSRSKKQKKRQVNNMSNATLQKKNKRMQLESNYKRLSKESQPYYKQMGDKWVSAAIGGVILGTSSYVGNKGAAWITSTVQKQGPRAAKAIKNYLTR